MKRANEENRLNRIHPVTNGVFNILFVLLALMAFVPIIFVFIRSEERRVGKECGS